jgi:hypothetical protein
MEKQHLTQKEMSKEDYKLLSMHVALLTYTQDKLCKIYQRALIAILLELH